MEEKKTNHNTSCHNKHENHLCYLMYEGKHYANRQEYKELVSDPQYICSNCGRTANDADNLCCPETLG
jgi:hypothetical protein